MVRSLMQILRRPIRIEQGKFTVSKLGAKPLDFREPYYVAIATSWPTFIFLALSALLIVVAIFALLFIIDPSSLQGPEPTNFARVFFFSLQNISTAGFGAMAPKSPYGYFIAAVERVIGIALLPVATGILFVRFSRARPGIVFADNAVVTTRDGQPQLRIRVANARSAMLTGAKARVTILLKEMDGTGEIWRRYHDLTLIRHSLPLFALTWTLMHRIDETSPLNRKTSSDLAEAWAQLVVEVEAVDTRVGHQVGNIGVYQASDIAFGKHYAAAMEHDREGATVADIRRLNVLEDDPH
ncbi:ion channel [Labrys okinawensis]|uniref:ion channel n=1 Tax=Labrys okinawensis TaxID=346911 RepID=UPI0039BCF47E